MKLIFFDIDGTLMSEDGNRYIPRSTKDAIAQARKNGHKVFVNSGRCFDFIKEEIRSIGFDGYVCGCGTEVIIDGKTIFHFELSHEYCERIAKAAIKTGAKTTYEGSRMTAMSLNGEIKYLEGGQVEHMDSDRDVDIHDSSFVFDKFSVWEASKMGDELLGLAEEQLRLIYRGGDLCETVPKGYTKATGMQIVADYYGLTLDDCVAFGDSLNDCEMIEAAGISVTMGRCKALDDMADFVTKPLEFDGIHYAMKHYKII